MFEQELFGSTADAGAIERSATLSPCRAYRYSLWRRWGAGRYAMFIGLNPSTADETLDDPTIRRCMHFSRAWGFDALCMANLFAFRSTDPAVMKGAKEPVGAANDETLKTLALDAGIVIAAWGAHGTHMGRDQAVKQLVPKLHFLRLTKDGHPGHPLYLPASLTPQPWASA